MTSVRLRAPAKVNLRLRVLGRESGGYHQLETVFQALDLSDEVDVRSGPAGVHLDLDGPEPCPPEENLAYRAASAFLDRTGIAQGVSIRLSKRIPARGGLGGGSSDAAAVLRAMNRLFRDVLPGRELERLAADLGSDVPFFLSPSPLALAWGRGDRFLPLNALPPAPVLLAVPAFGVETHRAFRALGAAGVPAPVRPVGAIDPRKLSSWEGVAELAANDLQDAVFGLEPVLRSLFEALSGVGARLSLLSGSGSTLFALFEDRSTRDEAAEALSRRFGDVNWLRTTTLAAMPAPG